MRYLAFGAILISVGCSSSKPAPTAVFQPLPTRVGAFSFTIPQSLRPDTTAKTYSRDDFKKLIIGKTMDEVKELLGKPYGTSSNNGQPMWFYSELVYDPESGQLDILSYVHFLNGKVERVGD